MTYSTMDGAATGSLELSHHVWIIDNEVYRIGRDGININRGSGGGHPLTGIRYAQSRHR
jgi:hypothetical protein